MNSEEQSQDFGELQRLLKLKRYEQPPPRYFNDFSAKVISHIQEDTSVTRFEATNNLVSRIPWLRRIWRKLEAQPALSGMIATVACGLMVAGVFFMEETAPQNLVLNPAGEQSGTSRNLATVPALGNNFGAAAAFPMASSTNISPFANGLNLFEQMGPGAMQPAAGRSILYK